jgi:TBC1 domain family protein 5
MSPTASTGVSVVAENHNLLNISMEVPQTPFVSKQRQSRHRRRDKTTSEERPGVLQSGIKAGHSRQGSSVQLGLPELIARNLLDRGESLGINKTVMSAVSELRVCRSSGSTHFVPSLHIAAA